MELGWNADDLFDAIQKDQLKLTDKGIVLTSDPRNAIKSNGTAPANDANAKDGEDIQTPTDVEAEAKAKLKGTVGGVQGIIELQKSVSEGTTDYDAAIAILNEIYGFDNDKAKKILGKKKAKSVNKQEKNPGNTDKPVV